MPDTVPDDVPEELLDALPTPGAPPGPPPGGGGGGASLDKALRKLPSVAPLLVEPLAAELLLVPAASRRFSKLCSSALMPELVLPEVLLLDDSACSRP